MSRWSRPHLSLTRSSGFSLVELIIIIIILGILSAVALPRFFRPADFEARFLVDDLKSPCNMPKNAPSMAAVKQNFASQQPAFHCGVTAPAMGQPLLF